MTEIRSISISKNSKPLMKQLEDKMPVGMSFTDSIMIAVESYVKGTNKSLADVIDYIGKLSFEDKTTLIKALIAKEKLGYVIQK